MEKKTVTLALVTYVIKFYMTIIYDIYIPMSVQLMENEMLQ